MSDKMSRERAARAEAVHAALARAQNPTIFETQYSPKSSRARNAEYGWQERRQQLPGCAIGFPLDWLKYQLTRHGYAHYFKHCLNRWWQERRKKGTKSHRRRHVLYCHLYTLGPFTIQVYNTKRNP